MAKTFNRMRIDVNEKPNSICINPVQNDTQSRYLDVSLYNNGLPIDLTGEVVRINFKKEDGTTFFNQGEITNAAEGRCQFALTNEVLSEAKTLKAQISIWSGEGEILSTQVFTIYVAESIRNDEEVESTNEFGVLVVLFQEIQNSLDLMQTIAENFGEPGEKAAEFEAETFWQMLEVLASRADTENILKKYIRLVLNSTIDTEASLPLDEMLKGLESKVDAFSTIQQVYTPVMTETEPVSLVEEAIVENGNDSDAPVELASFTAPADGIYFFRFDAYRTTSSSYKTAVSLFLLEKNGVYVANEKNLHQQILHIDTTTAKSYVLSIFLSEGDAIRCLGASRYSNISTSANAKAYFSNLSYTRINHLLCAIPTEVSYGYNSKKEYTYTAEADGMVSICWSGVFLDSRLEIQINGEVVPKTEEGKAEAPFVLNVKKDSTYTIKVRNKSSSSSIAVVSGVVQTPVFYICGDLRERRDVPVSVIKSIQTGVALEAGDIYISPVDVEKSMLLVHGGKSYGGDATKETNLPQGYFKFSNMISLSAAARWTVVEFR